MVPYLVAGKFALDWNNGTYMAVDPSEAETSKQRLLFTTKKI